jgi:hypothetical protein
MFIAEKEIAMRKWIAAVGLALGLSGCAVYTPGPRGCFWVPAHYDRWGYYHGGHWRC